jgi:two-component system nitrogen regulation sensor histidine kinase GlnL
MSLPLAPETDLSHRLLENLNTAVLLFDEELHLNYLNPAAEVLLAASARQARGVDLKELLGNNPDLIETFRRSLKSNHPFTERDIALSLPSGHTITVDCTVTPLNEPHHDTELLVEILRVDHHRRIVREESLLAQHNASRAVVRGLAHEIKNPLGGLRGAAQLLERELSDPSLKEYTGIIIGEADRLQTLVNRMLGPNTRPQRRSINIHQVVERVRTLAVAEAPPGVTIVRDYDPSIPDFMAEPDQLIQALLNIVRNALQAVGEQGEIILRTRSIRQATIGHHRHKLAARLDIIGLGLPIAQDLVNQHHGLIECHSEPGKTVFTLLLPIETNHEQS